MVICRACLLQTLLEGGKETWAEAQTAPSKKWRFTERTLWQQQMGFARHKEANTRYMADVKASTAEILLECKLAPPAHIGVQEEGEILVERLQPHIQVVRGRAVPNGTHEEVDEPTQRVLVHGVDVGQ
eukprot:1158492-Pelagomonas_calceolata.AAC.4